MNIEEIKDIFDNFEKEDVLDYIGTSEIIDFLLKENSVNELLYHFDESDLVEYLSDSKFITDDTDEAIEILRDSGDLPKNEFDFGDNGNRKGDAVELIQRIVEREGWNKLYAILEGQKVKMNLPC